MHSKRLKEASRNIFIFSLSAANALGQGFLVVDQSSGTTNELVQVFTRLPDNQIAQSFTPLIPAVGFVQLQSAIFANSIEETLVVNLRQGAYNGPIIGSTAPEFLVNKFTQVNTFYFPAEVAVTPGQLYFFEPMLLSAGPLDVGYKFPSSYPFGDAWNYGVQSGGGDYWFREGIVVPERSSFWFLLFGSGVFIWRWRITRNSPL